jgi:hypothetical protein
MNRNFPTFIVNENNVDLIFDMLDANEYKVTYLPGNGMWNNSKVREDVKEEIKKWCENKKLAISYIEINSEIKRYVYLTKWFANTEEMGEFIKNYCSKSVL